MIYQPIEKIKGEIIGEIKISLDKARKIYILYFIN